MSENTEFWHKIVSDRAGFTLSCNETWHIHSDLCCEAIREVLCISFNSQAPSVAACKYKRHALLTETSDNSRTVTSQVTNIESLLLVLSVSSNEIHSLCELCELCQH